MNYSKTNTVVFWILVVGLLVTAMVLSTFPIDFNNADFPGVSKLLATVFIITLFMERAQEVILTTWRAKGSESLDLAIDRMERSIFRQKHFKNANDELLDRLYDELEDCRLQKLNYRSYTRVLALRVGLLLGLMISLSGVRTLGVLIGDVDDLVLLSSFQLSVFNGVDIVLTGGVIAGGSDGIHKLAEFYRSYMASKIVNQLQMARRFDDIQKIS